MLATPVRSAADHIETIAAFIKQTRGASVQPTPRSQDLVTWGEKNYYIPHDSGTPRLIKLLEHQKIILRLFFDPVCAAYFGCENFQTLVFSALKKSGKTAIAGMIARWIAETWGSHTEVYCMANDEEQARGRIYAAMLASIELDPRYKLSAKGIPGIWRIIKRDATYLPAHGVVRAVSSDYEGEAGSNPVATLWSELWGFDSESDLRLWEELTPVPTRPRSIRYVETYAGYENESGILNDLEDRTKGKNGANRISHADLAQLGITWPWPDQELPFFVHPASRTFMYWDSGDIARRMPWQTDAYYIAQEAELRPSQFDRLHRNIRVANVDQFIPIQWWQRLKSELPALDASTPVVVAADASVTGDCSAVVGVTRDPNKDDQVAQRLFESWQPTKSAPMDYGITIEKTLREWCAKYNVVEIVYDQYQLHDMMTRLRNEGIAHCLSFSQNAPRMVADKALYDAIKDARLVHSGDSTLEEHIQDCGAKVPKDDNTKLRLVKKGSKSKIDGAVALSMASYECLRLML